MTFKKYIGNMHLGDIYVYNTYIQKSTDARNTDKIEF